MCRRFAIVAMPIATKAHTSGRLRISVIKLSPNDRDAYLDRCFVRSISGQAQKALADCGQVLQLEPGNVKALDRRAFAHLKMGKFSNAIKDYEAVLQKNPAAAEALYGRGVAMIKSGKKTKGQADLAAATALNAEITQNFTRYGIRI